MQRLIRHSTDLSGNCLCRSVGTAGTSDGVAGSAFGLQEQSNLRRIRTLQAGSKLLIDRRGRKEKSGSAGRL
jgi:hypothetical protein